MQDYLCAPEQVSILHVVVVRVGNDDHIDVVWRQPTESQGSEERPTPAGMSTVEENSQNVAASVRGFNEVDSSEPEAAFARGAHGIATEHDMNAGILHRTSSLRTAPVL